MREGWNKRELAVFRRLTSPWKIQEYLDATPYSADPIYRCPRRVIADRAAHCVDGGLFAAAALRRLGFRPLVLWIDAENDDGHLLALFRRRPGPPGSPGPRGSTGAGGWGAVGKSNFVGLRYREPVYRTLRELAMGYFDEYFNTLGERTMRSYRRPLDLSRFDRLSWMTSGDNLEELLDVHLERQPKTPVLPPGFEKRLLSVDGRRLRAGMLGAQAAGLFVPCGPTRPNAAPRPPTPASRRQTSARAAPA